jgi:hypothetical protein
MNVSVLHEILNELGSSLEALETQNAALLQFLKDQEIVPDDQLAPYLKDAAETSSVRWLATRVRLEHLIGSEAEPEQRVSQKTQEEITDKQESGQKEKEQSAPKPATQAAENQPKNNAAEKQTAGAKPDTAGADTTGERTEQKRHEQQDERKKTPPTKSTGKAA